jgi:hypothetical protein
MMFELVRTNYTVERAHGGHRTSSGMLIYCKVCDVYFTDKQKAREHRHEKEKQVQTERRSD